MTASNDVAERIAEVLWAHRTVYHGSAACRGTKSENQYDRVRHGRHRFANQTHCKQGHEFTPENTRIYNGHWRICKTCKRSPALTRKRLWTAAEIEVVSRPDLSHTEMAEILGRTVNAVGVARSRLNNDPEFRTRMTEAA